MAVSTRSAWSFLLAGAAVSFCGVVLRLAPAPTASGWAIIISVATAWVILIAAATVLARTPPELLSRTLRIVLWMSLIWAAYGRSMTTASMSLVNLSAVSEAPRQWQSTLSVVGEQAGAIAAMLGLWVLLSRHMPEVPAFDARRRRASQHERYWPWALRAGALVIACSVSAAVIRIVLVDLDVFPMAQGPFRDRFSVATVWASLAAGPYEEIGFTVLTAHLVVLMRRRRGWLVGWVCAAGLLRSVPHMYYASGPLTSSTILPIPDRVAAVLGVVLWCTMWAGGSLLVYMRYRSPWAIVCAHSAWNLTLLTAFAPVALALLTPFVIGLLPARWKVRRHYKYLGADSKRHVDEPLRDRLVLARERVMTHARQHT